MAGIIEVKDQGKLRIYDADNSNYVDIVVPSTVSSNRTITLPDASFTVPQADTDTVFNPDGAQVFNESGADVAKVFKSEITSDVASKAISAIDVSAVCPVMVAALTVEIASQAEPL